MPFMRAVQGGADAVDEVCGGEEASRLDDAALGMEPDGLDGIEPWALDRQVAVDDADSGARPLDLLVVSVDPGPDLSADMPGGIVPDQQQRRLSGSLQFGAAP